MECISRSVRVESVEAQIWTDKDDAPQNIFELCAVLAESCALSETGGW